MKKLIPLLLALTLMLSLSMTASADSHTYSTDDSATMDQTINVRIPDNKVLWELEIPATVTIKSGGYEGREDIQNATIVITDGKLQDGQKIEATLTYDGQMTLTSEQSVKLSYKLSDKSAVFNGSDYETLETGKAHVVGTMTNTDEKYNSPNAWVDSWDWDVAPLGKYEGTIVYSSELIDEKNA